MRKIIFGIILICIAGCGNKEPELKHTINKVCIFGEKDNAGNGWIGDVGFIVTNKNLDVYVIDLGTNKIKKYNKDGGYIRDYGNGKGKGPGEFVNPFAMDIDENNTIYVADLAKREITVIDSNNSVMRIIKTKFAPCNIIVTKPGIIYISGPHISYKGNLIYKYNINKKNDSDIPERTFCERVELDNSNAALKNSASRDGMQKDNNGNIYFCFTYPYEIRLYDENGNLLKKHQRKINRFDPPYYKQIDGRTVTISENGIADPMIIKKDLLCIRVLQDGLGKEFYDFYNINDFSYLGHIDTKSLGFEQVMSIATDGEGNIYYSQSEPYPHVVKIHLDLNDKP